MTGSIALVAEAAPYAKQTKGSVVAGYNSSVQPVTPICIESTARLQHDFNILIGIAEAIQSAIIGVAFFTALFEGYGGLE